MGFCYSCSKKKPDNCFYPLAHPNKSGRTVHAWCMQCEDQEFLLWIETTRKDDRWQYLNQYKLGRYGNTRLRRYRTMWRKQGGRCAICRSWTHPKPLSVDHDHKTNKVRGLLCTRCNVQLGKWHDNPPAHETKFIQYLNL